MNFNYSIVRWLLMIPCVFLPIVLFGQTEDINFSIHGKIRKETNQIFDSLVRIRRDFHTYPELAGQELRTSKKIAEYLEAIGLKVHTNIGGFGVVGVLKSGKKGKHIAWRADIDALPSKPMTSNNFSSKNLGVHHACGHDVHTTIALGIANVLSTLKDEFNGTIYFIFQPAEENLKGALNMMDQGLFKLIEPDEIYTLHIAPMPEGIITTKANNIYADYRNLQLTFKNTNKKDELLAYLEEYIANLQNIKPDSKFWDNRNLLDPNIGLGNPNTIFKDYVTVNSSSIDNKEKEKITYNVYLSAEKHTMLDSILTKITYDINHSKYAKELINIKYNNNIPLVMNNERLTSFSIFFLNKLHGKENTTPLYGAIPDGRSDDFSYFQMKVPGVYFLLGASDFEKGIISMPHSPNFAIDENSIKTGVSSFSSLIIERLQ